MMSQPSSPQLLSPPHPDAAANCDSHSDSDSNKASSVSSDVSHHSSGPASPIPGWKDLEGQGEVTCSVHPACAVILYCINVHYTRNVT